jgi:tetratricopeptide (TPR) repeat protein
MLEELQEESAEAAAEAEQEQEAGGEPAGPPIWLALERGKEHFQAGNYGSALRVFRDILEQQPRNANAHLWVGHVFFAEGDYGAAERKYRTALDLEQNFYPYGLRFEALYSLAEIGRLRGETQLFEETLRRIIAEGSEEQIEARRRRAMRRAFLEQGIDKLLELYRIREKRVRHAYAALGLHAFSEQRYEAAIEQLMLSTCISLSLAIEAVREQEYDWEFIREQIPVRGGDFFTENTRRFLRNAEERSNIAEYFASVGFYRDLFVLAAALHGAGYPEKAEALWLLTAEHREAGKWAILAREQLAEADLAAIPDLFDR